MPKPKPKPKSPEPPPTARFKTEYAKTRARLSRLEAELKDLKNQLFCLAHDPHTGVPHGTGGGVPHKGGVPHRAGVPHKGGTGKPTPKSK
ncbi:MAG TPA: hypothetical protein VMT39_03115 [Candidatus Bathyarchaeia archaeon]|nr:hypothetical protein [Candidatus Bathyarchaeia archaeon]